MKQSPNGRAGCGSSGRLHSDRHKTAVALVGAFALVFLISMVASAHEAWIEPYNYQLEKPSMLSAHLRVGQMFRGNTLLYNPEKFERLEVLNEASSKPVKGRLGDLPAIRHRLTGPGLHILVFVSTGQRINYENWEKFENFARKEGVPWLLDAHRRRGLPESDFSETYYRHVKSLVMVGPAAGKDRALGLRHEIVLQENPYRRDHNGLSARVLWEGEAQAGVQLTVFRKDPEGETVREVAVTDAAGVASFDHHPGHRYLLNAVHALPVEKPEKNGPVWLTHWASTTFQAN